ncbi:MAG TPA: alpha/beta fold hydrolase [Rhodocyclaceae bacterium]|nr:alpha/beta fold hydrolase [Rhodocyclaceae bacterium]HMV52760.1 alpha/beta fold hydrolase [Rhodocyclaceae bacterium]HMZ84546.1 alpha/beta fold hydrolase [Rhodocyclaceae bacterium]HNA03171.1 alpha/beta fold hydrolase [Rhodocyclaceae bacterium]HNB79335.1 alpha/beta fold hydrolase [Rhodocyclaceae bacterium]
MKLNVIRTGTGPDVVLLHGWSMDGAIWGEFAAQLSRDHRVHALDLPGHGASPRTQPVTLDTLAAEVASVLPDTCLLCGWSLGGMLALRLACLHPRQVSGLVLFATTPRFCAGEDWPHGIAPAELDGFAAELDADPTTLMARFRASMCRGDEQERALRRRLAALPPPPADRRALHEGLDILRNADLRAVVREIDVPARVIHGDCDNVVPPAAGSWLAANLPHARLHRFDACAHLPFLSRPEASAALVRQFAGEVIPAA